MVTITGIWEKLRTGASDGLRRLADVLSSPTHFAPTATQWEEPGPLGSVTPLTLAELARQFATTPGLENASVMAEVNTIAGTKMKQITVHRAIFDRELWLRSQLMQSATQGLWPRESSFAAKDPTIEIALDLLEYEILHPIKINDSLTLPPLLERLDMK